MFSNTPLNKIVGVKVIESDYFESHHLDLGVKLIIARDIGVKVPVPPTIFPQPGRVLTVFRYLEFAVNFHNMLQIVNA